MKLVALNKNHIQQIMSWWSCLQTRFTLDASRMRGLPYHVVLHMYTLLATQRATHPV